MIKSYFCSKSNDFNSMKKLYTIALLSFLALQSCNDGDVVYENLEFGNSSVEKCSNKNFYYKTSDNEIIILNIEADSLLKTDLHVERAVGDASEVLYRKYSDKVTGKVICDELPPAYPNTISELKAQTGGRITIDKLITATPNEERKSVSVNYSYTFNFSNIKFTNEDASEELKFDKLNFGSYRNSNAPTFNFNFTTNVGEEKDQPKEAFHCSTKNTLVAINNGGTLLLNMPAEYELPRQEGTQEIALSNSPLSLTYRQYKNNGALNAEDICSTEGTITITNNRLLEQWNSTKTGAILISTRKTEPKDENEVAKWHYTITVKNTSFKKFINSSNLTDASFQFEEFVFGYYIGENAE